LHNDLSHRKQYASACEIARICRQKREELSNFTFCFAIPPLLAHTAHTQTQFQGLPFDTCNSRTMQRALESALVGSRRTGARKKCVRCNPQLNKMVFAWQIKMTSERLKCGCDKKIDATQNYVLLI
jgi:hypothetical protein